MTALGLRRVAAAGALLLALPAAAQDHMEPGPRLSSLFDSTTSSIVLIEFWARDSEGHPMEGLGSDEIRLFVDGARRPIVTVEPALAAKAGSGTSPGPEPSAGTATAEARRFVLFFNDGMSLPIGMEKVRRAALGFVEHGGAPGDLFALASSEEHRRFRLLQDFSADRQEVLASLRKNLDDFTRASSLALELEQPPVDGAQGHARSPNAVGDPAGDRARQWELWRQFTGDQTRASGRGVVDGMIAVIQWLAAFRGPRAMLYFGDGLPGARSEEIVKLTRAATAASVTIHVANARGLQGEGAVPDVITTTPSRSQTMTSTGESTLASIALETGGLRVSSNDAGALFHGVDAEAAGAYVLSFVPEGPADGRSHSLKITCTRPGVQLRHRRIFLRETPEQTRQRALEAAFIAPELHADFGLGAMLPSHGEQSRDLVLYVPGDRLLFLPSETAPTAEVEIGAVARDDRGREVARLSRRMEIRLGGATASPRPAINLRVRSAIPAAARTVTAVVSDLRSGALGAFRTDPVLESHAPGLAGLAIGLPGERSLWISTDAGPPVKGTQGAQTAVIGAARRVRFTTTESPVCEVRLVTPRSEGGRRLRIVLMEGLSPALILPLDGAETRSAGDGGMILWTRVPLRDVPPGDLLLKVEETGAGAPVELGRLPVQVVPAAEVPGAS